MKYIKSYNESIKDVLKPKQNDQIFSELKKLPKSEILYRSFDNDYLDGIKYVLEQELLKPKPEFRLITILKLNLYRTSPEIAEYLINKDELKQFIKDDIYFIEKYKLGLHQEDVKNYDKYLSKLFKKLKYEEYMSPGHYNFYNKNEIPFSISSDNYLFVNDKKLVNTLKNEFNLSSSEIYLILKFYMNKYFNIDINTVSL